MASRATIHTRRVLARTGELSVTRTVDCPRSGPAPELESCLGCADAHGLGAHFVFCASKDSLERADEEAGLLTPVSEVMTTSVLCVRADVSVEAIAALLDENAITAAPVVDDLGRPIGVVSKSDLVRAMRSAHERTLVAADLMTRQVIWFPRDAPIASAAAVMAAERIHRALVLADDRRVIGIVSSLDLLRFVAKAAGFSLDDEGRG